MIAGKDVGGFEAIVLGALALVGLSMAAVWVVWWLTSPLPMENEPVAGLPSQCRELDFEAVTCLLAPDASLLCCSLDPLP